MRPVDELLDARTQLSHAHGDTGVSNQALVQHTKVIINDVACLEWFVARDTVLYLVIDGDANDVRVALIVPKSRLATQLFEMAAGQRRHILSCYPGCGGGCQGLQHAGQHPATFAHGFDFSSRFNPGKHAA